MEKIQIKNLRSLRDTGEIVISKINLLVGNNSSGKSTFLRVFPLIKQSFNKKINGPILWCGDDDDYVDFGSFNEALNFNSTEKCIKLIFELEIDLSSYTRYFEGDQKLNQENVRVEFTIMHNQETGYDYISQIFYAFRDYKNDLFFSERGEVEKLYINGEEIKMQEASQRYFRDYYDTALFGVSLVSIRKAADEKLKKILDIEEHNEDGRREIEQFATYIYRSKIMKERTKNDSKKEKIYLEYGEEEINKWSILYFLPTHFSLISFYLQEYFNKVYYIAPVRATAERYYKLRNLAVKEVDCRGKNLPVFLNSLSGPLFKEFQEWTKQNLGFEVEKAPSEGHVSLKILKNGQTRAFNLSDTGFGYSQILPIVTQLWYIARQNDKEREIPIWLGTQDVPMTFVIEQPELHLHPGLQAKLIDIIVKVAKQGKINFIIETHSETMINRIGNIIADKKIGNDDVNIIIFEKEFGDDKTIVRQGGFDEEGYLENWPVGFFEPEEE